MTFWWLCNLTLYLIYDAALFWNNARKPEHTLEFMQGNLCTPDALITEIYHYASQYWMRNDNV